MIKIILEIKRLKVNGADIRYIHAYNNNLLFYTDLRCKAVYSSIGNGTNRFEYANKMKGAAGLILDDFKNVYVCEKGATFIHVLDISGVFQRQFEVSKTPTAISVSENRKKICIICGGSQTTNKANIFVMN